LKLVNLKQVQINILNKIYNKMIHKQEEEIVFN